LLQNCTLKTGKLVCIDTHAAEALNMSQ